MMKSFDLISLTMRETKNALKSVILYCIILTLIFSLVLTTLTLTWNLTSFMQDYIDGMYPDGIDFSMSHISEEDIDVLQNLPIENVSVCLDSFYMFSKNATLINKNGEKKNFIGDTFSIFNLKQTENMTYEEFIKSGTIWTSEIDKTDADGVYKIWFGSTAAEEFHVQVGDEVTFEYENTKKKFRVAGIYDSSQMWVEYIIPLKAGWEIIKPTSYNPYCSANAKIHNISQWTEVKNQLHQNNIYTETLEIIERILDEITLFSLVLWVIALILILLSVSMMIQFTRSVLSRRQSYIGMMKALGMNDGRIAAVFILMMEAVILLSVILGSILERFVQNYIGGVITELFGIASFHTPFNFWIPIIAAMIQNVFMLIPILITCRRISKVSVVDIISNKE